MLKWMNVWCINVLVGSLVDSLLCLCLDLGLSSVLLKLLSLEILIKFGLLLGFLHKSEKSEKLASRGLC